MLSLLQKIAQTAELQQKYAHLLRIPRRPTSDHWTTVDELHEAEDKAFLLWRAELARLEDEEGVVLTPFERNLELWRQLWRVVERSDVVVQIVDARHPLLFRSLDLEAYARELNKRCVLLVNKADTISSEQRRLWAHYCRDVLHVEAIFWSATIADVEKTSNVTKTQSNRRTSSQSDATSDDDEEDDDNDDDDDDDEDAESETDHSVEVFDDEENNEVENDKATSAIVDCAHMNCACGALVDRAALISHFESMRPASTDAPIVVGMVGYPNVGKSSTINRLMGVKKVPVSATPGRTRHLQTLLLNARVTLCDCPGLVMPSLAMSRAQMQLAAILPVDHMSTAAHEAVELVMRSVPLRIIQSIYGVQLPSGERAPTVIELLTCVAFVRGFMSSNGVPDCSRAARMMVKGGRHIRQLFAHCRKLRCNRQPTADRLRAADVRSIPLRSHDGRGAREDDDDERAPPAGQLRCVGTAEHRATQAADEQVAARIRRRLLHGAHGAGAHEGTTAGRSRQRRRQATRQLQEEGETAPDTQGFGCVIAAV